MIKINSRTLAVLLIIAASIIAAVVIFKVRISRNIAEDSQVLQSDIIKDWKTFSFNQNITFKYPSDWYKSYAYRYDGGISFDQSVQDYIKELQFEHDNVSFDIKTARVGKAIVKILIPKEIVMKTDYNNGDKDMFNGAIIVKLPYVFTLSPANKQTDIFVFSSGSLVKKSDISSAKLPTTQTWKTLLSTMAFTVPPSIEDQLKPLGPFCKDVWKDGKVPTFEDFPVTQIFSGKPASLDTSTKLAQEYVTRFNQGLAGPANFAGHYATVAWGCGSNCPVTSFVDLKTGQTYGTWGVINVRPDSSLFIDVTNEEVDSDQSDVQHIRKYYQMTDSGPQFLCSELVTIQN